MTDTTSAPTRTHTFSWQDPMIGAQAALTMSGLEYFQAIMRGEIPFAPITHVMQMGFDAVEAGRVVFKATPAEYLFNPIGTVHGGFAATVLDSVMGCAVHSTLPAGTGYTTAELHINYIRPIFANTGTMLCEGKVIHSGRKMATAEGRLVDADGKLYAHGTTTCIILSQEGK
jgi:uncharacterized protein (TIGR00369 family)